MSLPQIAQNRAGSALSLPKARAQIIAIPKTLLFDRFLRVSS
jgi:hypothetical protein